MKRIFLIVALILGLASAGYGDGFFGGGGGSGGSYTLPAATSSTLGGVKPDGTSIINNAGAISVTPASIGATVENSDGSVTLSDVADPTKQIQISPANLPTNTKVYIYGPRHLYADTTGLTYNLSASAAVVTSANALVINQPGTYVVSGVVATGFSGATYAAVQNVQCYLYRTNNTAAVITNTTAVQILPIVTTFTLASGPTLTLGPVSYTTSNATDSLSVYCSVSATPAAGNMQITGTHITAVRIGM